MFSHRISGIQAQLLMAGGWPCVAMSEVDGILAPDPSRYPGGLREFLSAFMRNTTVFSWKAKGMELAHVPAHELPMNWSVNLLPQRHFWGWNGYFDKNAVTKLPILHGGGFHDSGIAKKDARRFCLSPIGRTQAVCARWLHQSEVNSSVNPDVRLIHLHHADRDLCSQKATQKYRSLSKQLDLLNPSSLRNVTLFNPKIEHPPTIRSVLYRQYIMNSYRFQLDLLKAYRGSNDTTPAPHAHMVCGFANSVRVSENRARASISKFERSSIRRGVDPFLFRISEEWLAKVVI